MIYIISSYVFTILLLLDKYLFKLFLKNLIDKNVFYYYKTNNKNYISYIFIAYLRLLRIFYNYHNLILLDYPYNFNQFKIPLLNIVGVTEINITIQVVIVFIKAEKEANYV